MKKILVRAPDDQESVILSFSFMHALKEEYPQDQIYIIASEQAYDLYSLLPFKVFLHLFPLNKNNLPGIHHYAYNLNEVFNIDIYFDLIDDFKSTFMGFAFRAKERMGPDEGLKKYFLTKRFSPKVYSSCDLRSMDLLMSFTQKDFSQYKIFCSKLAYLKGIIRPYLLLLIDDYVLDEEKRKLLLLFLNSFERQKFIFWNHEDDHYEKAQVRANFYSTLVSNNANNNEYEFLKSTNYEHLSQLILASKAVFSDQNWKVQLGAYYAKDAYFWGEKKLLASPYFKFSPSTLVMNNDKVSVYSGESEQSFETVDALVDYLHTTLVL